jgi:hypothetical protein
MGAREDVADLTLRAAKRLGGTRTPQDEMLTAILRYLNAIDDEILKLRKELRTRNGGEDA